jgi:cytochrome P450
MEGVLILATLAQRWRLRLVPGHRVEPQPLITLRPRHGMRMVPERREI